MAVTITAGVMTAQTSAVTSDVAMPAHNPGDLLLLTMDYNDPAGNAAYVDQVPAGWTLLIRTRNSTTLAKQATYYKFDDAGTLTTVSITRTTGSTGNQRGRAFALAGADRTTPFRTPATFPEGGAQVSPVTVTFTDTAPAGSLAMVLVTTNGNHTRTTDWTAGWTYPSTETTTTNLTDQQAWKAFGSDTVPGTVAYTPSASRWYSAVLLIVNPAAGTTATTATVAAVSSTGTVQGSAGTALIAVTDNDDTTFLRKTVTGTSDTDTFTLTGMRAPNGAEDLRVTHRVRRNGGTGGTWRYQLMQGSTVIATHDVASTGTSLTTIEVVFTAAELATLTGIGTYFPSGVVIDAIQLVTA